MAKPKPLPIQRAPWQRLDNHDGLVIDGVNYRVKRSDRGGQLLYEADRPKVTAFYDHAAWEGVRSSPGYQHRPGIHDPDRATTVDLAGVEYVSDIPDEQLMPMHYYETLILELEMLYASGGTKLEQHEVQTHIDGDMGKRAKAKLKQRQLGASALGGRAFVTFDISGSALLRKRRDYKKRGFEGLRDGRFRSGKHDTGMQPDVAALIAEHIARSKNNPSATARSIHDDIRDDIEEYNEGITMAAASSDDENSFAKLELLRVPDVKTIRKAKAARDEFQVAIGTYGLDVATQLLPAVRGKPDYLGPLDRVEYDESLVDAITLLTQSGIWNYLTKEEKAKIKRVRMVIGVAICVATRCIVGMRIYGVGNGDETVETFKMILEDKTKYIPLHLQDRLSWHQHGGIGTIVLDQGSSNISDAARTVLANLEVPMLIAQAGRPDQRGTGERIFRTLGSEVYSFLDARTGSNVVDRRKYRPEDRASLTIDELWKVLALGVVGIYHNTPHRELDGRTPAYEWERLVPDYGVNALPDPNRRRVTFGRHRTVEVTRYGVSFAGLSYTNPFVDHHYLHGHGPIEIAGDPDDLGAVSVKFGEAWYEATCTDPDMWGVRWADWYTACAPQKDLASADAQKRRAARRAAKKAMRAIQDNARDRENIHPPVITDQVIENGERRIFGKYRHADDDQEVTSGLLGTPVEPDNGDAPPAAPQSALMPLTPPAPPRGNGKQWKMKK